MIVVVIAVVIIIMIIVVIVVVVIVIVVVVVAVVVVVIACFSIAFRVGCFVCSCLRGNLFLLFYVSLFLLIDAFVD